MIITEYYTTEETAEKFISQIDINKEWRIICPCDDEDSEIYKALKNKGLNVDYSTHLQDVDYSKYDIVITNPTYVGIVGYINNYFSKCPRMLLMLSDIHRFIFDEKGILKIPHAINWFCNGDISEWKGAYRQFSIWSMYAEKIKGGKLKWHQ